MNTDELREKYLSYFESKGCVRRPTDVLVPRDDPTVLFTPAGMNQFKAHFLGKCKLDFTRATTCQKCMRTGDIENVGRTAYHHTFFEMLGNFSFGDYFKPEAIRWAWEFLTRKEWLALDPDRLTVSVYHDDQEAHQIWTEEVGLPSARVARLEEDENFWPASAPSKGPDGVCGPCSEIFYHPPRGGAVEIWNLVFTQFNRVGDPPKNLHALPSKNIDTGMGLERAAAALQQVDSNFHIDILLPLVQRAGEVCGLEYDPASESGRRLRRIADHVRACVFAIHENVVPGPNKEKYVIKRLLRRAVLDGHQLGRHEPFLYELVSTVAEQMRAPYPELRGSVERVAHVIEQEEANFFSTIDAGLNRIDRVFEKMKSENRPMVSGAEAADMYTTHGFPPELFETLAAEHNLMFDWEGFRGEMQRHGLESGADRQTDVFAASVLDPLKKVAEGTEFLGYETTESEGRIVAIVAQERLCEHVDEIGHDQPIAVLLDRTPFYGEAGGQVGDIGELGGEDFTFEVIDTRREGSFLLHQGHLRSGELQVGARVAARLDLARREGIRRAHSATHLLHFALQKHLGDHAQQQGSKVDRDWLRFDFTHPSGLNAQQRERIEDEVNRQVMAAVDVTWQQMPIDEARELGATMLFGEKYPDVVRVVSMGDFSRELCGGTHLESTGQVGLFKILGEESVAAGTRRITALTGPGALAHVRAEEEALADAASILRVAPVDVPRRVAALVGEVRELKKTKSSSAAGVSADELLKRALDIAGIDVIVEVLPNAAPQEMRQLIDQMRKKSKRPLAAMLFSQVKDSVAAVAGTSQDIKTLASDKWIQAAAQQMGGSGGGRPHMAQAGGKDSKNLPKAKEVAVRFATEKLGG